MMTKNTRYLSQPIKMYAIDPQSNYLHKLGHDSDAAFFCLPPKHI